jgi:hypothetical protein
MEQMESAAMIGGAVGPGPSLYGRGGVDVYAPPMMCLSWETSSAIQCCAPLPAFQPYQGY